MNIINQGIINRKRVLSSILVALMLFLQLPQLDFTAKAVGVSSGIDLSSTTGWTRIYAANGQHDPQGDQQTGGSNNSVSQDIVGNSTYPSTYMKFSEDKTEIAFRIRVNNQNGRQGELEFKNFAFTGIDANGNGTVDFFLGVYNPTGNNGRLGIYNSDPSALNAGPSSTGISGKPLMAFAPVKDVNYSIINAGSEISGAGEGNLDPDYFITYKFKLSDISNAIAGKTKDNVTFTSNTAFRFITGTAAQDNAFNQDISGMAKDGWKSGKTWAELEVFSPVFSASAKSYYAVTFDKNTGDTAAADEVKIIENGNTIGNLPAVNPTKRGMYFQEWNTSLEGTGTTVKATTVIDGATKVYAIWSNKPVSTVTFNGNGGGWSDGAVTRAVPTINGVIGDNMPVNPTKASSYFIGWGTTPDFNQAVIYDSQTPILENTTITLYALWDTRVKDTAVFHDNIGINGGQVIATLYPNPSGNIQSDSLPNPTRTGYTFSGWYSNIDSTGVQFIGGKITSDVDYYAKWIPATYTLTYSGNGGTLSGASFVSVTSGKFVVPIQPIWTNHIFIEWNKQADGRGEAMYESSDIAGNTTVYAIWQTEKKVTLNANGGVFDIGAPTVIDVKNNKLTELPIPPSKTDFTFLGWSTSSEGTSLVNLTGDFTTSTTLYAVWSPIYTVTFDANTGAWSENVLLKEIPTAYGNVLYNPEAPTREEYIFDGWNTESNGGGTVFNTDTEVTGNIRVYAQWKSIVSTYSIRFVTNNEDVLPNAAVLSGGFVTKPGNLIKSGYSFGGWYKDANFTSPWNFDEDTVTADTILYLKWNINSYTVSFNSVGGSSEQSQSVSHGGKVQQPSAPIKSGYGFGGWYKDADYTSPWNFSEDTVTANTTLYAKWNINSYTVTFNSVGGSSEQSRSVSHGGKVQLPSAPTKSGYSFGGWYKDTDYTSPWNFSEDTVTSNTTLYVKWNINSYTVSFNSVGGSYAASQSVSHGGKVQEPNAPIKAGYVFGGWYKDTDYTSPWNFNTDTVTANTTLYAKWNINSYTVTFNSMGGSTAVSQSVSYGGKLEEPTSEPTKSGYSFGGWFKDVEHKSPWNFNTDTVTGNTTLFAKWNINNYTVSFNSVGGSTAASQSISHGGKVQEPSAPTKTGYGFGGWYKDANYTSAWNFNTDTVTANATLYAKWNVDSFIVSGTLKDDSEKEQPVPEVKVYVERGGRKVAGPVYTDLEGKFTIYGVPAGVYNLVIEYLDINGNTTIITQIIVVTGDTQLGTIRLPLGRKNSIFVPKDEVSVNAVGKLNEVFDYVGSNRTEDMGVTIDDLKVVENGGEVIVRLESDAVNEATQAVQISDVKAAITNNNKYLGHMMDLSVYKDVTPLYGQTKTNKLKELNNLVDIYITIPEDIQSKTGYAIYRYHDGIVNVITETPNANGEKIEINGNSLILTVQKFSVYAIAYDEKMNEVIVEDKQNDVDIVEEINEETEVLPKTGSAVDFTTLIMAGVLSTFAGVMLLRRKRKLD